MEDLRAALRRALSDLEATVPGLIEVIETDNAFVLLDSDGHGPGVPFEWVTADRLPLLVTETVQEAAIEALWRTGQSAVWPVCPDHPKTHPLQVRGGASHLMWACPNSGRQVARVGQLSP